MSTFGDFGTFGGDVDAGTSESPVVRLLRSFDQLATIYTRTAGAEDDYGNPADVFTSAGVWPCLRWQGSGRENQQDRETEVDTSKVDFPPDAPVNGHSKVLLDGVMYQVVGPPVLHRTPRGPHHLTANLQVSS